MLKKIGLILVMLGAGAVPALADDACVAPAIPATVDGASLTQPQMVAAIKSAKDYIAASDVYQQCLEDYIASQKAEAAKNKTTFDSSVEVAENAKVDANQASKQKVGDGINASIAAYKSAHPGK